MAGAQEYLPLGPMSASEKAGLQALKAELLDSIKKGVDFVNRGTNHPSSSPADSFLISRDDIPSGGSMGGLLGGGRGPSHVQGPPALLRKEAEEMQPSHSPQRAGPVGEGGGVTATPAAASPEMQSERVDLPRTPSETTGELYAPQAGKGGGAAETPGRFNVEGGHVKEVAAEVGRGGARGRGGGEGQGVGEGKEAREEGARNVEEGESGKVPSSAEETTGSLYSAPSLAERGRYKGLAVGTPSLGDGHVQAA